MPGDAEEGDDGVLGGLVKRRRPLRRVLVLGGTGFLGSAISRAFVAQGLEVTILARTRPSGLVAEWCGGAKIVFGSVSDKGLIGPLIARADHVVYAVGCPFPAESNIDPVGDIMATIPPLIDVVEAVGSVSGVGFSFLSSGGTVYGNPTRCPVAEDSVCDPTTPYGVTKLAAEKYIGLYSRRLGIPAQILRVANAYGAIQSGARGQGLVAAALNAASRGETITLYGDGVIRDYIDARDVANAVVALAWQGEGPLVVNVGSGVGHSVRQVVELVERVTGVSLDVIRDTARPFDVREIVLDMNVLRGLVRWEPIDLEEGIRDAWLARLQSGHPVRGVLR